MGKIKNSRTPDMYVTAYELARNGKVQVDIAKAFGVHQRTLRSWLKYDPELKAAIARGRKAHTADKRVLVEQSKISTTFKDYLYSNLSPKLRDMWEKIQEAQELSNGRERVEVMLKSKGRRLKQNLLLYALSQTMFNVTRSLNMLCIPKKTFDNWCKNDPEFADLISEIHWHKKNFIENALLTRVAAGDTTAIIFAAKSQCADRGYGDKIQVEHTGSIDHRFSVNVADLDLDLDTRKKLLQAARKQKAIDVKAQALSNGRHNGR